MKIFNKILLFIINKKNKHGVLYTLGRCKGGGAYGSPEGWVYLSVSVSCVLSEKILEQQPLSGPN